MKTPKSSIAPADRITSMRFNAEDAWFLAELQRATGITQRADLIRNCIRIAAKQHGITSPPTPRRKA